MRRSFVFIFSFIVLSLSAQEKLLTIEDASYMNPKLFPARVRQLQWIGETEHYAFAKENSLYKVSARRGTETLLLDLDMLNTGMRTNGYDSLKRLPRINLFNDEAGYFQIGKTYYEYNYKSHQLWKVNMLPDSAENIDFNNDTRIAAFTIKNNLYYAEDGKVKQITFDKNPGIVNGHTVHRVEFGIKTGIFWSPDGKKIAFYRKDETMVADYPLVDINQRIAKVKNIKYPMAGETSQEVTLGVYDLETGKTVFMKTGEPKDHYLTAVTWGPESKTIYIAILNRDQNHLKLNRYDVATGALQKTLFEEENPKYVEPENPLYFRPEHNDEFIWQSERDGYNHLYLFNTDGKLLKQLTKGDWVVTDFLGYYGKEKNEVWFLSTKTSPLQKNIYKVNIENGKITRISPDHGTHYALISKSGKYVIDIFSSTDITRKYQLVDSKGKTVRVIQKDKDPLADYKLGQMTISTLRAPDGTELYYRLIKPVDFDSTKKYPVIVYVYGGPHAQLVTDSWLGGAGLFLNFLAERGYIIFTLDNRGSANRGLAFEQAIFRNVGTIETKDQMVGINFLESLPYVDTSRIGVDGWSYGGFMTLTLKLRHPEIFKVAVAGGPVIDWKYYEVMYGERYMDTPQTNPEGYKKASVLNYVKNMNGKALVIHGTMDPTVVWQHSLLFIEKAVSLNKQVDYFVYPGHGHGVGGKDRVNLNEKIWEYFRDNL
ncbi:MAG: S9 family peptidase [Chlorobi bacterium]|nr:S9 family peptidase [Chlorobiota bacterium]